MAPASLEGERGGGSGVTLLGVGGCPSTVLHPLRVRGSGMACLPSTLPLPSDELTSMEGPGAERFFGRNRISLKVAFGTPGLVLDCAEPGGCRAGSQGVCVKYFCVALSSLSNETFGCFPSLSLFHFCMLLCRLQEIFFKQTEDIPKLLRKLF